MSTSMWTIFHVRTRSEPPVTGTAQRLELSGHGIGGQKEVGRITHDKQREKQKEIR